MEISKIIVLLFITLSLYIPWQKKIPIYYLDFKVNFHVFSFNYLSKFLYWHFVFIVSHRPYHAYCLYVGANSDPRYTEVFQQVISCYQKLYPHTTIFMATNTTEVKWGKYSLIEADFHCMRDLLSRKNQ